MDLLVLFLALCFFGSKLAFTALGRDQARRTKNHHQDQNQPEQQTLIFGRIQLGGQVCPGKVDDRNDRIALAKLTKM